MEYNVKLSVKIISHDKQTWIFGSRDLKLPFAPTIGIALSFSESISQPITNITYSLEENIFFCYTVHEIESADEDLAFLAENYKKEGWSKLDNLFVSYVEGGAEIKEGVFEKL